MPSEYTDAPRTRVMTPAALNNGVHENQAIGQTMAIAPKKKLFDDLSIPQIIAGAAAAATSVALSSKIGIAGSVIGAAVSSVVTVVSSQVYRHFLSAGAEAIKNTHEGEDYPVGAYSPARTLDPNEHLGGAAVTAQTDENGMPVTTARMAPDSLRAKAAAERSQTQKKVILFSVIAAVAAVALSAGIILVTTAGEGLGERPASIIATEDSTKADSDQGDSPSADSTQNNAGPAQNASQSSNSAASNSDSSNTQGGTSSTDTTSGQASGAQPSDSQQSSGQASSSDQNSDSSNTTDSSSSSDSNTSSDSTSSNGQAAATGQTTTTN